ncbi:MAG: hypothetical protein M0022_03530 [Desulfobacteraceae bacterium]|nr:hypothetical protein [Desulfobacteraceae bacterium]
MTRVAYAAYPYPANFLFFHLEFQKLRGIYLDIDELSPWLLVASKTLHELCIAINAGMPSADIGVQVIFIDLGLGKDGLCIYFTDVHGVTLII